MIGKVFQIGVAKQKGNQIMNVKHIEVLKNSGIIGDRNFKNNNDIKKQITLIEIENINYYNKISNSNIPPIDFRRNIITENISLNNLVGKEFFIGQIKIKAHDLCRPCKYLQDLLDKKDLIKKLMLKSGLRCEVLSNGKISSGDKIST
jgi:MOSC domain-containing protein YiiM